MKKKNKTLGWKLEKGSLEQKRKKKFEDSWAEQIEEWKAMTRQHPKPLRGPLPFPKPKIWTLYSKMLSLEFQSLSWWVLTPVKLPYSDTRKKWIFLRCLIFKKFVFPEKDLGNVPPLLLNQIVKINLLSQIIISQVDAPFGDFLTVITNFLGTLSQKEDDFSGIINWVWKYFGFRRCGASFWK